MPDAQSDSEFVPRDERDVLVRAAMVPYHKMLLLTRLAAEHGVSLETCLADANVDEATLNDPLTELHPSQSLAICANAVRAVPEHLALGVAYGRRLGAAGYGELPVTRTRASMVRTVLRRDASRIPRVDDVASEFSLSRRSLSRRLEAEGHTFRALVDEARRGAAEQLLRDRQHGLEEVAARIGYADKASFIRAFKRWHGVTPAQWRRAHGASEQATNNRQ